MITIHITDKTKFYAVVTNCESGNAEYKEIKDMKKTLVMFVRQVRFLLCQERSGFIKSRIWMVELQIPFRLWKLREWEMRKCSGTDS